MKRTRQVATPASKKKRKLLLALRKEAKHDPFPAVTDIKIRTNPCADGDTQFHVTGSQLDLQVLRSLLEHTLQYVFEGWNYKVIQFGNHPLSSGSFYFYGRKTDSVEVSAADHAKARELFEDPEEWDEELDE